MVVHSTLNECYEEKAFSLDSEEKFSTGMESCGKFFLVILNFSIFR